MSGFPAWGSDKGTGNPQGIWPWSQQDLIIDFHRTPVDWEQRLRSWRKQTKSCAHKDPEERSSNPTADWTKTYLHRRLSRGGMGQEGLTTETRALAVLLLKGPPSCKPSLSSPLTLQPRAGSPQAKKLKWREQPPHLSADNWIKALLSKALSRWAMALPITERPSFFHHQSLSSGSLHKPLSLLQQTVDRRNKKNHNTTVAGTKPYYRKLIRMKQNVTDEGTR